MLFQAGVSYFQTDHIVRIRKIAERAGAQEPVRYTVYLIGQNESVDVAGADVPAFEAWLARETLNLANAKPDAKTQEAPKGDKKVA